MLRRIINLIRNHPCSHATHQQIRRVLATPCMAPSSGRYLFPKSYRKVYYFFRNWSSETTSPFLSESVPPPSGSSSSSGNSCSNASSSIDLGQGLELQSKVYRRISKDTDCRQRNNKFFRNIVKRQCHLQLLIIHTHVGKLVLQDDRHFTRITVT